MMIQLKNGEYACIHNQRDVVDIARKLCGDDFADLLERINWEENYQSIANTEDELHTAFSDIQKSYDKLIDLQLSGLRESLRKLQCSPIETEETKEVVEEFLKDSEDVEKEYICQLEKIRESIAKYEDCFWDVDVPDIETLYV